MQIPMGLLAPLAPALARHQSAVLGLRLRKALGRRMQNPPISFYDKIFWMASHSDTSLWTELADKVGVRNYVAERCGSGVLTNLYGVYEKAEDVDFDALPDAFVVKTNNGCASNYIVRSKEVADLDDVRSGLGRWLDFPYGELTGQLHYSRIKPRILAEELLFQAENPEKTLTDFKFFCFNGEVRYCYAFMDRVFDRRHSHKRMMYDTHWGERADVFVGGANLGHIDRPSSLEHMLYVAKMLSSGIPFVRVDLYEVNGAVKFGEMTFMPGMHSGFTEAFQQTMGEMIELPVDGVARRAANVSGGGSVSCARWSRRRPSRARVGRLGDTAGEAWAECAIECGRLALQGRCR